MEPRVIFKVAAVVLAGYGALVLLTWWFQRSLMYIPTRSAPPPASVVLGEDAEEVRLSTEDGLQLAGWFLPGRGERRPEAVIVFNGNAGDRSLRGEIATALAAEGLSVLLFDYRGYGGNAGSPTEEGLRADARAALSYLRGRDDVDPERIVYLGESLGTALAIGLAVEHPPRALILRSPFTSMADVGQRHFPFLPVRWLILDRYSCVDRIAQLSAPILVIAGDADGIVPPRFSRRLFEAAPEPKQLVMLSGVDHNDAEFLDGRDFIGAIVHFLRGGDGSTDQGL